MNGISASNELTQCVESAAAVQQEADNGATDFTDTDSRAQDPNMNARCDGLFRYTKGGKEY